MYKLILILTFTANGASIEVEEMEFNTKSACQEALIQVLRGYERDPASHDDTRILSRLHVEGYCVAKG